VRGESRVRDPVIRDRAKQKSKKPPDLEGCGGCLGEPVVPSAGRRTRAKEPEREGNDDNDAAHFTTNRRRLL